PSGVRAVRCRYRTAVRPRASCDRAALPPVSPSPCPPRNCHARFETSLGRRTRDRAFPVAHCLAPPPPLGSRRNHPPPPRMTAAPAARALPLRPPAPTLPEHVTRTFALALPVM